MCQILLPLEDIQLLSGGALESPKEAFVMSGLPMWVQVTAVDRSPGTVSGCLVLGSALAHQWGAELAAEKVLPVLTPLLTSPSLSPGHFAAALQCAPSCRTLCCVHISALM